MKQLDVTETTASAEDYLETILLLSKKSGSLRSVDISDEMGFSRPSVSIALKKLRTRGLIAVEEDGSISLTAEGEMKAEAVYGRHLVLLDWLVSIGVSEKIASLDACKMEHILSDETLERVRAVVRNSG